MKSNVAAIILILACLGLGAVLWQQNQKHAEQTKELDKTIASYSNDVTSFDVRLKEQVMVNATLETNLAATQIKASNDLAAVHATLATTSAELEKAQADAKATAAAAAAAAASAEAALAERDKKIAGLENQNTELDKQSNDLRNSLTNLEVQIQATQKKLDASEGDKKLLMEELKTLQAKKAELEVQLTNLAFLKDQVKKLKDQLAIDRRLDWIRRGIYDAIGEKGGERLTHPPSSLPPSTNPALDVELRQNGGVKINPPATPSTNAPSTNAPSAK
jgi:chromosome segregation ATPase